MSDRETADDIRRMYGYQDTHGGNVTKKLHGWFGGHCNEGALHNLGVSRRRRNNVSKAFMKYGGKTIEHSDIGIVPLDHIGINDVHPKENKKIGLAIADKLDGGRGRRMGVSPQEAEAERKRKKASQRPGATPTKRPKLGQESRPGCVQVACGPSPQSKISGLSLIGWATMATVLVIAVYMLMDTILLALMVLGLIAVAVGIGAVAYVGHQTARDAINWDYIPVWRANRQRAREARQQAREELMVPQAIAVGSTGVAELPAPDPIGAAADADLKAAWVYSQPVDQYVVR